MKKKILSIITILLMFVMLITLTGCGNESKKDEEETASSPKEVVEEFLGYVEEGKFSKASKLIDWTLAYKVDDENYYSYEDYDFEALEDMPSKEIKEYKNDNEDDIEYFKNYFESYETDVDDMASFKININLEDDEKVDGTKNIYLVEAEVEMNWKIEKDDDEETSTETIEFYIMKDDGEYKIIDGITDIRYMLADMTW